MLKEFCVAQTQLVKIDQGKRMLCVLKKATMNKRTHCTLSGVMCLVIFDSCDSSLALNSGRGSQKNGVGLELENP